MESSHKKQTFSKMVETCYSFENPKFLKTNQDISTNSQDLKSDHLLNDEWCLWAHLPHDTDWSLNSYKNIYTFSTLEEAISLYNHIPSKMVRNCMLFLMRKGITPLWEDPKNRDGGCFSYKLINKIVPECWKKISFCLIGESLSNIKNLQKGINGITISPKKNFCILKIWTNNCDFKNCEELQTPSEIDKNGCIFKQHAPEY